ncbi:hypothetical protein BJX65DRAFT_308162 [Aspergillus insuetus]
MRHRSYPMTLTPPPTLISLDDFRRWNPSITASCGGLESGKSYCVEAWGEPAPSTTTTTKPPTTSTITITIITTTKTGNAPGHTQSGQIETCNRWDFAESGATCSVYLSKYPGLTLANLVEWISVISSQCQNLWVDTPVQRRRAIGAGMTSIGDVPTSRLTSWPN